MLGDYHRLRSVSAASAAVALTRLPHRTQANALKTNAFVPHAAVLCLGFLFAYSVVPETRGKSLEQIEQEMSQT